MNSDDPGDQQLASKLLLLVGFLAGPSASPTLLYPLWSIRLPSWCDCPVLWAPTNFLNSHQQLLSKNLAEDQCLTRLLNKSVESWTWVPCAGKHVIGAHNIHFVWSIRNCDLDSACKACMKERQKMLKIFKSKLQNHIEWSNDVTSCARRVPCQVCFDPIYAWSSTESSKK